MLSTEPQSLQSAEPALNILCADDNQLVGEAILAVLRNAGHAARFVLDGREALDAFLESSGNFDLLITDYEMPFLDGYELIRELKRQGHRPRIIVITGNLMAARAEALTAEGVDVILEKPIRPSSVLGVIHRLFMPVNGCHAAVSSAG